MTTRTYHLGYLVSMLLTSASFALVWLHQASRHTYLTHQQLFWCLAALAGVQVLAQLIFFLHVGRSTKARDAVLLGIAGIIIFLVVGGSLWIMANLSAGGGVPFDGGTISPQTEF